MDRWFRCLFGTIALGAAVLLDLENHHNFAWRERHRIGGVEREVIVPPESLAAFGTRLGGRLDGLANQWVSLGGGLVVQVNGLVGASEEDAVKVESALVAHEAVQAAGFGAEVAATVAEELGCPVKRLGSPRIPVGYASTLEAEARVDAAKIARTTRTWLGG